MNDELVQAMIESVDPARDLSDETLYELVPHDHLMAKISAGIATAVPESIRTKRATPRHRVVTFVGATVAAGSVAVAAALMLFGSSPALVQGSGPTKTTLPSPILKSNPEPENGGTAVPANYAFTADPSLSTAGGTATAYELTAPADVSSVTGEIATALGVSGSVTYLGPGNYQAGPNAGPDVTVDVASGVLQWQYPTWTNQPPGSSVSVNETLPLLTDSQASAAARQVLLSMGMNAQQLGAPEVWRYSAAVNVEFPMEVDGISTDQSSQVSYGPGAAVLTASGVIVTAAPSASYPTISPAQAVSQLPSNKGNDSTTGSDVTVDINKATPELWTYVLANGTSWLLPTWALSGPEIGSSSGPTYGTSVLAVPARFVQLEPK